MGLTGIQCWRCSATPQYVMLLNPYKVYTCHEHVEWDKPVLALLENAPPLADEDLRIEDDTT